MLQYYWTRDCYLHVTLIIDIDRTQYQKIHLFILFTLIQLKLLKEKMKKKTEEI